jgi:hypothetical protein
LDTPVCLTDGRVIGLVEEVIGPVKSASYCVRLAAQFVDMLRAASEPVLLLYPLVDNTKYVFPASLMDRGCDASTLHDTEVQPEEREFSDDEEERKATTERKKAKKELQHPQQQQQQQLTQQEKKPRRAPLPARSAGPPPYAQSGRPSRGLGSSPAGLSVNLPVMQAPSVPTYPQQGQQSLFYATQQQQQQQQWQQQWSQYASYQLQAVQPPPPPMPPGAFSAPPTFAQQQEEIQRTQAYLASLMMQQQHLLYQQQHQQYRKP